MLTRNKSVFINKFHIAKEKQFPKAKGVHRSESAHNNSPARVIDLAPQILVQISILIKKRNTFFETHGRLNFEFEIKSNK